VHHRTIQINHQPDATVFQFIVLTFVYSPTCFGRFPAHHQELNDCSGSLCSYLRIVMTVVLCSWSGRLSPRYEGKSRGCHCSHWAPDHGRENAFVLSELTRLVVEERQLFVGNFITKRGKLLRKLQICYKYLSAVVFQLDVRLLTRVLVIFSLMFHFCGLTDRTVPVKPEIHRNSIQDSQFSYNVTSRRVCETIFFRANQQVQYITTVSLYSCFRDPARTAHAPCYTVICGLSDYTILFNIVS